MEDPTDDSKMVPLHEVIGKAWNEWEHHRRICCLSQNQFINHLLRIHTKACNTFQETNSLRRLEANKTNGFEHRSDGMDAGFAGGMGPKILSISSESARSFDARSHGGDTQHNMMTDAVPLDASARLLHHFSALADARRPLAMQSPLKTEPRPEMVTPFGATANVRDELPTIVNTINEASNADSLGSSEMNDFKNVGSAIQHSLSHMNQHNRSLDSPITTPSASSGTGKSRGNYCKYSVQFKRTVCQYARLHDIQSAQKHFSKIVPQLRSKTIYYWLSVMKLEPPGKTSTDNAGAVPVYTRYSPRFKHQVCEYAINHSLREAVKEFLPKAPKICDTLINYWMKKHDRSVTYPDDNEEVDAQKPKVSAGPTTVGSRFTFTEQLKYEVATYAKVFSVEEAIKNFRLGGVELDAETVNKWVAEREDEPLPGEEAGEDQEGSIDGDDDSITFPSTPYAGPHVTYTGKRRPHYSQELMLDICCYALQHSIHGAINAFRSVTPLLSRASVRRFMLKNRQTIEQHMKTISYVPSPVKYTQPEEFKLRSQYLPDNGDTNTSQGASIPKGTWEDDEMVMVPSAEISDQWYDDDGDEQDDGAIVVPLNGDNTTIGEDQEGEHVIGIEVIDDDSENDDAKDADPAEGSTSADDSLVRHVAKKSTGGTIDKSVVFPPDLRQKVRQHAQEYGVDATLEKFKTLSPSLTTDLIKRWMHVLDDTYTDEPLYQRSEPAASPKRGKYDADVDASPRPHSDTSQSQQLDSPSNSQYNSQPQSPASQSSTPSQSSRSTNNKSAVSIAGDDYSHLPQHVCEHAKVNGIESAVRLYKPVIPDLTHDMISQWLDAVEAKAKAEARAATVENSAKKVLGSNTSTEGSGPMQSKSSDIAPTFDGMEEFKTIVCTFARHEGVESAAARFSRSDTKSVLSPDTIRAWLRQGFGASAPVSDSSLNPPHSGESLSLQAAAMVGPRRRCARYSPEFKKSVCEMARSVSANAAWKYYKQIEPDLSIQIISYWLKKSNF